MKKQQQNSSISSSGDSQFSDESELNQRPAFFVPSDMEQIDEQQRQAFDYLISVRTQASNIKTQIKAKRKQFKKKTHQQDLQKKSKIQGIFIRDNTINQQIALNNKSNKVSNQDKINTETVLSKEQHIFWVYDWIEQTVNNWLCVVSNIQFLQKNQATGHTQQMLALPASCLSSKPLIFQLFHIGLGAVEDLISSLSQHYYYEGGRYYYLWMYSLLAVHRATAEYSIFDALGSLNSCLLAQQKHEVQIYVVAAILKSQFGQKGLQKMLNKAVNYQSSKNDKQ